jgi:hypothetical protein
LCETEALGSLEKLPCIYYGYKGPDQLKIKHALRPVSCRDQPNKPREMCLLMGESRC